MERRNSHRWTNTPNDTIADERSQSKREEVRHQSRASELSERNDASHPRGNGGNLPTGLLPWSKSLGRLFFRSFGGSRRRSSWGRDSQRSRWENFPLVHYNRPSDDLILQIDNKAIVLRHGQEELGDIVRVECA